MQHGTRSGYSKHKCRCAPCKKANSEARRRLRDSGGANLTKHGTLYGYQGAGCRCIPCTEAATQYSRIRNGGSAPKLDAPRYGIARSVNNRSRQDQE